MSMHHSEPLTFHKKDINLPIEHFFEKYYLGLISRDQFLGILTVKFEHEGFNYLEQFNFTVVD